jgi:DNA-binding HxlR family transcriptional regulator
MAVLSGVLADRTAWSAVGECPIERTIALVGTRSALLILREAYYGTTRFDDFCRRVGITKAAAAARLDDLVEAGLLTRSPYQEPGQRTREEYVLTAAGTDFMPVVWALFQWGQQHLPDPVALRLAHADCNADVAVEMRCGAGHFVAPDKLTLRLRRRS